MGINNYGFQATHSIKLTAIKLIDYILHETELTPVNIYIDFSKTFDSLNFDILLHKLHYYGIIDISLKVLKSYMSNKNNMLNIMSINLDLKKLKQACHRDEI